jgi:hypothetical protein
MAGSTASAELATWSGRVAAVEPPPPASTVQMIIDQWNPSKKQHRFEALCRGSKSCPFHRPGPTRKGPGPKGMSATEESWFDEDAVLHRGPAD